MDDAHLSRVVLADFIQLSPSRTATVTYDAVLRRATVTLAGRTYAQTAVANGPAHVAATLERRDPDLSDELLGWKSISSAVPLSGTLSDTNLGAWTGSLTIPEGVRGPFRIVLEEFEIHKTGDEVFGGPEGRRLVHSDLLVIPGAT